MPSSQSLTTCIFSLVPRRPLLLHHHAFAPAGLEIDLGVELVGVTGRIGTLAEDAIVTKARMVLVASIANVTQLRRRSRSPE